ncbi:MAG: LptA/OstA family protein, partial [Terrimicrobiaceae bacterium]|nr:LptA/OstA family protein [Terrimicrobiaceae bacterium]
FFGTLIILCVAAFPALGQQRDTTPAPSKPGKADATGFGIAQKDRPKNAKTEISCKDEATFDNASGIATFVTTVYVKDPQFNLYCDKLTVFMNKERKGIDHAEAEGHVVIVQDNTDDKGQPTKSIGRSGKAVFVPATGDATLTVWPQLQQGINNHVSTEATTVMVLNRNGHLKTTGGSRTVITDAQQVEGSSRQ